MTRGGGRAPNTKSVRFGIALIAATVCSLASFADATTSWSSCGDGREAITIHEVKLVPDPVVAGTAAAFDVAAAVAAGAGPIPGGSISVGIKYRGAEIATETVELCDTTDCPTPEQGPISIKYSKTIPAFIPPGPYTIEAGVSTRSHHPSFA